MGTIRIAKAILMSTHNICFMENYRNYSLIITRSVPLFQFALNYYYRFFISHTFSWTMKVNIMLKIDINFDNGFIQLLKHKGYICKNSSVSKHFILPSKQFLSLTTPYFNCITLKNLNSLDSKNINIFKFVLLLDLTLKSSTGHCTRSSASVIWSEQFASSFLTI